MGNTVDSICCHGSSNHKSFKSSSNSCDNYYKEYSVAQQIRELTLARYAAALGKHGIIGLRAIELDFLYDGDKNLRLYSTKDNVFINEDNLDTYVVAGEMYEVVANLCEEFVHDLMMKQFDLVWCKVFDYATEVDDRLADKGKSKSKGKNKSKEFRPIRALVSRNRRKRMSEEGDDNENVKESRPVLVVATGRGKVGAGIFSRRFLMTHGVEIGSCMEYVREAAHKNMDIVLFDPNVNSEREGMFTFMKTFEVLFKGRKKYDYQAVGTPIVRKSSNSKRVTFENEEKKQDNQFDNFGSTTIDADVEEVKAYEFTNCDLYILSHSASGGHLLRTVIYDVEEVNSAVERRGYKYGSNYIHSIAFTDSTHNIQWVKESKVFSDFLQNPYHCLYVKSENVRTDEHWSSRQAGDIVDVDSFWIHRFGTIPTIHAGTKEHSLINHTAKECIWIHYKQSLDAISII